MVAAYQTPEIPFVETLAPVCPSWACPRTASSPCQKFIQSVLLVLWMLATTTWRNPALLSAIDPPSVHGYHYNPYSPYSASRPHVYLHVFLNGALWPRITASSRCRWLFHVQVALPSLSTKEYLYA